MSYGLIDPLSSIEEEGKERSGENNRRPFQYLSQESHSNSDEKKKWKQSRAMIPASKKDMSLNEWEI